MKFDKVLQYQVMGTFIVLDDITQLKISTSFTAKFYCIEYLFNPSLDFTRWESYQLIKNFITVWVMLFTGRQTRWDVLTWDVLTLGRFDFGHFDLEHFHLRRFHSGTFWLWGVLTWDVLTLGHFDLGCFDSGTFWLGTFWLWDVLTWDDLTLGHFDQCVHKKCLLSRVWLNIVKIYLGRFWLTKNGTVLANHLGRFWFWDVFDRIPLWPLTLCNKLCLASIHPLDTSLWLRYHCNLQDSMLADNHATTENSNKENMASAMWITLS